MAINRYYYLLSLLFIKCIVAHAIFCSLSVVTSEWGSKGGSRPQPKLIPENDVISAKNNDAKSKKLYFYAKLLRALTRTQMV